MTMEECSKRYNVVGFEDGEEIYESKNVGGS